MANQLPAGIAVMGACFFNALIPKTGIFGKQEEKKEEESGLATLAERTGKACFGVISLWIAQACVAEVAGATAALAAATTTSGLAVGGGGVVAFAAAAAGLGKLGVDLMQGKSLSKSMENTGEVFMGLAKAISAVASPFDAIRESSLKPASSLERFVKMVATAAAAA